MHKTIQEHDICFGIPFRTWLVILAVIAIGLIHAMSIRPTSAIPRRSAVSVPAGGRLALIDELDMEDSPATRYPNG